MGGKGYERKLRIEAPLQVIWDIGMHEGVRWLPGWLDGGISPKPPLSCIPQVIFSLFSAEYLHIQSLVTVNNYQLFTVIGMISLW